MRIIGVDPGTVCCGYGVVELKEDKPSTPLYIASGDIRMDKKAPLPERLKVLFSSLKAILDEYRPSHLCIEKIFYHKSIRSAFALGSIRGVAMLLAADSDMPVFEYNPTEIKMALTGYGRAEKQQVKQMVVKILDLKPSPLTLSEDSTDALALCICHINYSLKRHIIS